MVTSWDIELGETGFTPTGAPTATGVTNPYNYVGLTEGTTYDWYVRADCGGPYSSWEGPSTFTTLTVLGPGQGIGTSYNGEMCYIDVIPLPITSHGLGPIDPDVWFQPMGTGRIDSVTVFVNVLENTLQIAPSCPKGKFPLSYGLYFTGDTAQAFNITLQYTGWYHGSPASIYYWDGFDWTYPQNIVFGPTSVTFDITGPFGPANAVAFHLKNKPQPSDGDNVDTFTNTNYPNPFNPVTNISFSLSEAGFVTLEIFNTRGQKVRTLINSELNAGSHQIVWDGKEESGKSATSGVYFYKLKTANYEKTMKMILLK